MTTDTAPARAGGNDGASSGLSRPKVVAVAFDRVFLAARKHGSLVV